MAKDIPLAIAGLFAQAGRVYMTHLEQAMRRNGQVVSGDTLAQFKVKSSAAGMVITGPRYSGVLQDGRRPGKMPPTGPIIKWLQKKGLSPKLAFPIAKKMQKEGSQLWRGESPGKTKPTNTFTAPIKPTIQVLQAEIIKLVGVELSGAVKEGFK